MTADWKQAHANEAEQYAQHEMVESALSEFAMNMGFERKGLPEYGLLKIVSYVAQVVLAGARGFDPELLRMTPEEATEAQLRLMRAFQEAGKPVVVVVSEELP
jgi:hypothetical protein